MLAFKRTSTLAQRVAVRPATRAFATLDEKERGEEKAYFSKADAKLLKKLAEKMAARDEVESTPVQEHSAQCDDLEQIFERHQMDKNGKDSLLWQELMEWRRIKY